MRVAVLVFMLGITTIGPSVRAQEVEQAGPLFLDEIPIHWIEPAHRALQEFRTRHRDDADCFNVLLHEEENGGFSVSFAAKLNVTPTTAEDGEEGVLLSRSTTCGFGETFHYDADGQLIRHNYMRH